MVSEGSKIRDENIAIRASDIDVIWVYGYGWPVYRGGPMFWADSIGTKSLRERLLEFKRQSGDAFWTPAPLLDRLPEQGKGLTGEGRAAPPNHPIFQGGGQPRPP